MFELDRLASSMEKIESSVTSIEVRLALIEAQLTTYRSLESKLSKVLLTVAAGYVLFRLTGVTGQ